MRAQAAILSIGASASSSCQGRIRSHPTPRFTASRSARGCARWLALLACALGADAALAVPRFTSTPVTAATEGENYRYDIRTADSQNGLRRVTAPVLPAWLSLTNVRLSNGSARLSGTPTAAHVGTHAVTLQVTNVFTDATDLQSFSITVAKVNDAPVITGQTPNPIPLAEGASLTIQLSHLIVTDADDTYPAGFSLTVLNGTNYTRTNNTITPSAGFTGTLTVPVRVSDGTDNSNTFNVRVGVSSNNQPPEAVGTIPSQLGTENVPFQLRNASGEPTSLAAFFRDPDAGDTLRYQATGLPPSGNLVLDATSGEITGVPRAADVRATPYTVAVSATDGKSTASQLPRLTFDLTIAAPDDSDVALSITVTPAPALTGDTVQWSFTIANSGPQPADSIELAAEFAGNPFAFATLASCSVTPVGDRQQVSCTVPTVAAATATDVTVTGQAAQSGDVNVTATVSRSGTTDDPNPANNSATAVLNVAQQLSSGPAQILPSANGTSAAVGDVDGDGFVDLALAKSAGNSAELYLNVVDAANAARRQLADTPIAIGDTTPASDLALADLDGDADLDMVLANATGQANRVYLNAGTGTFTLLAELDGGASNAVAVADFDADGFADLAFANNGPNAIHRNQAGAAFALGATLDNDQSQDVLAIDFDLDNLPDLVFANANGPSRFYRNLGTGTFAPGVVIDSDGAEAIASGDFNNDGRPDLVFARRNSASGLPSSSVYQNNPGGAGGALFVLVETLGASPTLDVLAADLDNDGATDVVAINATGTHQVYRGIGAGRFALHPVQFMGSGAVAAALGKFSVDTSVDLAVATAANAAVFFNDGRGGLGPGDTTPPSIQLLGAAAVTVDAGTAYQDAGATATDDIDGNLTASIVTNNEVNTTIVGNYAVTYAVMDSSGNAAQMTRDVRVAPREGTGGGGGGANGALALALLAAALYFARRSERRFSRD